MKPTCDADECEGEPLITRPVALCVRHAGKVWEQVQHIIAERSGVQDGDLIVDLRQAHGRRPDIPLNTMEVWALRGHIKSRNGVSGQGGMYLMSDIEAMADRPSDARPGAHDPVVYYLGLPDGTIKIGYTTNLYTRATQLYARDSILAIEPGGRERESERHAQFRAERVGRSERFRRTDRLMRHIRRAVELHGEPDFATLSRDVRLRTPMAG